MNSENSSDRIGMTGTANLIKLLGTGQREVLRAADTGDRAPALPPAWAGLPVSAQAGGINTVSIM